jgi:hypothetical protein
VVYAKAEILQQKTLAARAAAMRACPVCGQDISNTAPSCPHCGEVFRSGPSWPIRPALGYGGAAVLATGVFAPIFSAPVVGSFNYFRNGQGDGVFILILAAITVVAVAFRRWFVLYGTGGGSLLLLGYTLFEMMHRVRLAKAEMAAKMTGNPFSGLASAALDSAQLQWGWAVLVAGALLTLAAAVARPRP